MIVCQKPLGAMVKMIVMDLDGTLLDHNENISQYTLSIMERRRIKIVITTAIGAKAVIKDVALCVNWRKTPSTPIYLPLPASWKGSNAR